MKTFYEKYKKDIYSQQGEDGIIAEALQRIGITKGSTCEFGAHDGKFCSNTRALLDEGWKGLMIEGNAELFRRCMVSVSGLNCTVKNEMVTPENVNKLVPADINLLSIDCDGPDYGIWKAYEGKPEIVVIEINSGYDPDVIWHRAPSDPVDGTLYTPMVRLGIQKGYFLLCHTGNLIFVRNDHRDKFPEIVGDGIENWQDYFQTNWLK